MHVGGCPTFPDQPSPTVDVHTPGRAGAVATPLYTLAELTALPEALDCTGAGTRTDSMPICWTGVFVSSSLRGPGYRWCRWRDALLATRGANARRARLVAFVKW
ncbi:MAG: hypothetical protein R2838_02850 [Caldilineaceae bacterium]